MLLNLILECTIFVSFFASCHTTHDTPLLSFDKVLHFGIYSFMNVSYIAYNKNFLFGSCQLRFLFMAY